MAKALDVNENGPEDRQARPQGQSGGDRSPTLQGKSFQVNENTVEEGEPIASSPPPSESEPPEDDNQTTLHGRSFQVNENTVEEGEPLGSPASPPRNPWETAPGPSSRARRSR
ncbi:hypothetical protein [Labrys monachus]|uniref:Uncharacterized protein n=1 Tax=Labrys monachus TaxID=217067 RepID=A0ABU0FCL3_9HYPH|nr:hypothetical protein [Labrys monachus]MDQ0391863.1 hypothetical protein [Labrys monachus]